MKPYIPFHILLALTLTVTGILVFYNFSFRESYATTLRYDYPVVEQSKPDPEEVQIQPEPEPEPVVQPEEEILVLSKVQFPLDINTATVEQLKFIPKVGDVLAQRIVQYRVYLGGAYTDLEQLRDIKNVGDKTYINLATYLYIAEPGDQTDNEDK